MTWVELAAAGVVGGALGWLARFAYQRLTTESGPFPVAVSPTLEPPAAPSVVVEAAPPAPPPKVEAPPPPPPVSARPLSPGADASGRVILHLHSLGRLDRDEVAPVGFSQRGMIDALAIPQGTLAKVLGRLEAAGILEVDRRHVSGQPRRLKVYRLTGRGELVARDLRTHRGRPQAGSGAPRGSGP